MGDVGLRAETLPRATLASERKDRRCAGAEFSGASWKGEEREQDELRRTGVMFV